METRAIDTTKAKKNRGIRTEGYRASRKRLKSLQAIPSEDPLLSKSSEAEFVRYAESVLEAIGRPSDLELHKDALCKVSSTLFPSGFAQQVKAVAASETAKRLPLGLPKISGSLIVCELLKVGLSLLDPKRIQGTLPLNAPPLIERSRLAKLVKDFTFNTSDSPANITVSFPSILLAHASQGFQYKTSDILAAERSQASKFRRLVSTALADLQDCDR